ncbi:hypothetical protein L596_030879 [Steinernema carpocapsae]|uniref:Uncharacterized protein n=1 Tax=Steinernema carpocapsae TaxID=34508 RepID=A0A4V5ZWV7_STECR|nr:hypothetical protein L596_030879 [Steinernema carpocapsae]
MADPEDYDRDEVVAKWVDEELEDDIEAIDIQLCRTRLLKILLHLGLSFIFLGVCAGALIYSFARGEAGTGHHALESRNASKNFTINVNEYSATGYYQVTLRYPDYFNKPHPSKMHQKKTETYWYQNNHEQKLVHKIDEKKIAYVFQAYSYWVQLNTKGDPQTCHERSIGYKTYIANLGLESLHNPHSEMEITKNGRKVFIYDGDPQPAKFNGTDERAFLVRAYADQTNGALLGWDTYFGATNESKIYKTEYWYGDMLPTASPESAFDYPKICEPGS